jgi:hypothetical protein
VSKRKTIYIINKIAKMKQCNTCNKVKETTQFSKCNARKDGLQNKCKQCNSKDNKKFRTEINPEHHAKWQNSNWDKLLGYLRKYRTADKAGIVYAITNPIGETYIGMSEMYLNNRMLEHRKHYKQYKQGKRTSLPGLHDSFDKYGVENHKFKTIFESEDIDRKQLEYIESSFIEAVKQTGKSLNIRK